MERPETGATVRSVTDSIDVFLARHKGPMVRCIMDSVADLDKFIRRWPGGMPDPESPEGQEFAALPEYLALYFRTGDSSYRNLYIGELLKVVHSSDLGVEEQQQKREEIVASVGQGFSSMAELGLTPGSRDRFRAELESMHRVAASRAGKRLDVLFVGDCLGLDVVAFLAGPCRESGIDLNPTFVGSHNPIELRNKLQSQPGNGFALVFYSPFTYTFLPRFTQMLESTRLLAGVDSVRKMIAPDLDEVRTNLNLIVRHFDCPVMVHNASILRRHNATLVDRAKIAMNWQLRRLARRETNWVLGEFVKNLGASARVSVIDEGALLDRFSEWTLGRRFYDSAAQHPSVLSRHLAETYLDYLRVHVGLMTKKLVVCDLDNTLWAGEIGEGAVTHFGDRQATLKRLREKGVLLAINSKNDPKNVHWTGSVLSQDDFVATQINWDPKAENMRRIRDSLNLKTKDFVFIDDRPDQIELVSAIFPEILALDATDEQNWRHLDLWSRWLPEQDGPDRTRLYHEREKREGFIAAEAKADDPAEYLGRLGLKATLRTAGSGDLKRVVDLINRTNQFNLNGTRITLGELREWLGSPGRSVLLVDGADKFGQMGTVCVALVEHDGVEVRIPAFVLSCRVFGYGFETALLNAIKRQASKPGGEAGQTARIVGSYQETPSNQPCRSMYPDHGFVRAENDWVFEGIGDAPDPAWLAVSGGIG